MQLGHSDDLRQREQQAEREALMVICHPNFTECLLAYHLPSAIEVDNGKGKRITIAGSDISDKRTWTKFLASTGQTTALYQLTDVIEPLAQQYTDWLLTKHTKRYQSVVSEADIAWLHRVATLAVTRHIMEHKYEAHMTQKLTTFALPSIIPYMATLVAYAHLIKESARIAHRVFKNSPQAQTLIEQFATLYRTIAPELPRPSELLLELSSSRSQENEVGEKDKQDD